MSRWKLCPKCSQTIPEHWSWHGCGWNVKGREPKREGALEDMERVISDAIEVLNKIRQKYPEHYPQLDLTKIALTLFIHRRRED